MRPSVCRRRRRRFRRCDAAACDEARRDQRARRSVTVDKEFGVAGCGPAVAVPPRTSHRRRQCRARRSRASTRRPGFARWLPPRRPRSPSPRAHRLPMLVERMPIRSERTQAVERVRQRIDNEQRVAPVASCERLLPASGKLEAKSGADERADATNSFRRFRSMHRRRTTRAGTARWSRSRRSPRSLQTPASPFPAARARSTSRARPGDEAPHAQPDLPGGRGRPAEAGPAPRPSLP